MPLDFALDAAPAILAVFGLVALGMALLPRLLHQRPLSFPVLYVAAGFLLFQLPLDLPFVDPAAEPEVVKHVTEVGVIVALFGVGLKIRRPVGLRGWAPTWRLLGIVMPATIAAVAALAVWLLDLDIATAVLLGAALAPTDPVLAADVQEVSPHHEGPGDVRFALTSEAGLNDALAFPFTKLALVLAVATTSTSEQLLTWAAVDVVYRVAVGLAFGLAFGLLLRIVVFRTPLRATRLSETGDGLVALAGTFLTYGVTELAQGYGFLAVFVAAQVLRNHERDHEYHDVVHDFAEQIERLVNGVILVLFGGAIADGLLAPLTLPMIALVALLIFVIRPLIAWVGVPAQRDERSIVAFFGIRGVGSLFYLAYALAEHEFSDPEMLWAVVGAVVSTSIVVHGLSAGPAMRRYDHRRTITGRRAAP